MYRQRNSSNKNCFQSTQALKLKRNPFNGLRQVSCLLLGYIDLFSLFALIICTCCLYNRALFFFPFFSSTRWLSVSWPETGVRGELASSRSRYLPYCCSWCWSHEGLAGNRRTHRETLNSIGQLWIILNFLSSIPHPHAHPRPLHRFPLPEFSL